MKKSHLILILVLLLFLTINGDIIEKKFSSAIKFYQQGKIPETIQEISLILMNLQNNMKLKINNLNFCSEIREFSNYDSLNSFSLSKGQNLLLYLELEGFSVKKDNKKFWIHISEDMKITDSNGKIIFQKDNFITYNKYFFVPIIPFYIQNRVTSIPVGKYTYHLTIKDHIKGSFLSKNFNFEVK